MLAVCLRQHLLVTAAAGVLALTPAAATAALSDAFSPGPRLDLALELDYRGRYLTSEHVLRDEPPPDRLGQEQLADTKDRVAREYVRELTDALFDEMLEIFPLFEAIERRYEALTTFRFFQSDGNGADDGADNAAARSASRPDGAAPDRHALRSSRAAPDRVPVRWVEAGYPAAAGAALPDEPEGSVGWSGAGGSRVVSGGGGADESPARVPITVRFRLNAGLDRVAPSVEVTRGSLRYRVSFDAARERVEVKVTRRLWDVLDFELVHAEVLGHDGSESRLAITLPF